MMFSLVNGITQKKNQTKVTLTITPNFELLIPGKKQGKYQVFSIIYAILSTIR